MVIDNITINKNIEKGQMHIYKPVEEDVAMFKNSEENEANQIIYTGEVESDIKKLEISNQGGLVVLRCADDNVSNYVSNEAQEVDYSKLLQITGVTLEELSANVSFDLSINLTSGKTYKANITLDIPVEGVVENGTSSIEITDVKDIIFKRLENN